MTEYSAPQNSTSTTFDESRIVIDQELSKTKAKSLLIIYHQKNSLARAVPEFDDSCMFHCSTINTFSELAPFRRLRIVRGMVGEGQGYELGEDADVWGYSNASSRSDTRLRGGGLVSFFLVRVLPLVGAPSSKEVVELNDTGLTTWL